MSRVKLSDGTSWPCPRRATEVAWLLRYGSPTRDEMLVAAEVLGVYARLIDCPWMGRALPRVRAAIKASKEPA